MSSEQDWIEASGRRWDFTPAVVATDEVPVDDYDVGYEAALPGLQALYADAAEARLRIADPREA